MDCRSAHEHFQVFLHRLCLSIVGNGAYYLNVMFVEIGSALPVSKTDTGWRRCSFA